MECPKCGNEQSDGWLSCQKCHIIFSRWKPDASASPCPPAVPPRGDGVPQAPDAAARPATLFGDKPPEPPRTPTLFGDKPAEPPRPLGPEPAPVAQERQAGWPAFLALLLPLGLGLWWMLNPRGRAIEPGSFRDNDKQFAIRAPEGWVTLTRDNVQAIISQFGSQLPAQVSQAMASPGMAVSIVRLVQPGEFAPSLNVMVVKGVPPPINEKSKQEAAKAIADGFSALLSDYKQESVKIVTVDKIRSLEILSTAASPFRLAGSEELSPPVLRYRQLLVPGKKRTFIVTCTDGSDAGGSDAAFRRALDSFRVLQRPPRFGPILNGGIIGGLVGALFYALAGLLRALGSQRR
jgi:hypothetical protein